MGRARLAAQDFPSGDADGSGVAHGGRIASWRSSSCRSGTRSARSRWRRAWRSSTSPSSGPPIEGQRAVSQPHERLVLAARGRRAPSGRGSSSAGWGRPCPPARARPAPRWRRCSVGLDSPVTVRLDGGELEVEVGGGPARGPDRLGGPRLRRGAERRVPGGACPNMKTSARLDRLPPYLFAELERKIAEKKAAGVDVISLGIGDPDTPTPASVIEALAAAAHDPGTHQYPSNRGRAELREAVARFYDRRFGVELDPETEIVPGAGRQGVHLQPQPCVPRPRRRGAGGRPRLPGLHGRAAAGRGRGRAHAAAARARLRPRPGRDLARCGRQGTADVPELPEQPDRGGGARGPVRAGRGVRARARRADRARRLVHRDHLRRLRGAELPADAGGEGRGRRGVLAVQGLQHDRLAHGGDRRQRGGGRGLLEAEDQHRLGHARGGAAGGGGGARRRRRCRRAR